MTTTTKRLLMVLTVALAACGTERRLSPTLVIQLQVTPPTARVASGLTQKLTATAVYEDGHTQDLSSQVAWVSTDATTATVDANGLVTGTAAGSAQVVATVQGMNPELQAFVDVDVTAAAVTALELSSARDLAALPKGSLAALNVQATFTDGTRLDVTADATWSSNQEAVAQVEGGRVRALDLGNALVVVSLQGQTASLPVTVTPAELVGLSLTPAVATAPLGSSVPLLALGTYTDGSVGDVTDQLTWTSVDPLAVQVSNLAGQAGHAFGLVRYAQSVVTAQLPGTSISATSLVVVGAPELRSFKIDQASKVKDRMCQSGNDLQLTATATFTDDTTADATALLSWESFSPSVALADPAVPGLVHALSPGSATIVVTLPHNPMVWMSAEVYVR